MHPWRLIPHARHLHCNAVSTPHILRPPCSLVSTLQAFDAAQLVAAKRRLAALLADPGMRLPDLAAEVARLAGGEASAARERAIQDSIHRMLSRSSGAMKVRFGQGGRAEGCRDLGQSGAGAGSLCAGGHRRSSTAV